MAAKSRRAELAVFGEVGGLMTYPAILMDIGSQGSYFQQFSLFKHYLIFTKEASFLRLFKLERKASSA